jgi:hypothetical protein
MKKYAKKRTLSKVHMAGKSCLPAMYIDLQPYLAAFGVPLHDLLTTRH